MTTVLISLGWGFLNGGAVVIVTAEHRYDIKVECQSGDPGDDYTDTVL